MKLLYAAASPYARKVLVVAHERGLDSQLTLVTSAASPVARNPDVVAHNPTGKIPTLILDDGTALYDSRVIAEYLDALQGPRLFPAGAARWPALCLQSLADEMMGAALLMRYEGFMRPEALRWTEWMEGQKAKVLSSLAHLEERWIDHLDGEVDIGTVATACGLGYLDFRFADLGWRNGHDRLAQWYETFAARPSMTATAPA
jgi:glutathione S-transferase